MMDLFSLQRYLDDYLFFDESQDIVKIDPYMTNGLMVKGKDEIKKIGFAVSASMKLFEKAKKENCDCIIVHHSFNLPKTHTYDYIFQERIDFLLRNKISLFGYHFLLDAHPEIGNNVSILKTIGSRPDEPYLHHGHPWGYTGIYDKKKSLSVIKKILKPLLSPLTTYYDFGPKEISRLVAVSGKGAPLASDMTNLRKNNIDLFITGEVHEWNRELFREAGINFIAGGHYHTERFGIKALMDKVSSKFSGVDTLWLELDSEI